MHDPNIKDFYKRVARLEKARARGEAFEAPGTLGRSYYHKRANKRRGTFLVPLIFVVLSVIALKATIHYNIGPGLYNLRVAELQEGKGVDKLGAVIMAPDPATLWLASVMRQHLAGQS